MALLPCSAPVPLLALRGGIIALSEQYHGRAFHSHGWRGQRTVYRFEPGIACPWLAMAHGVTEIVVYPSAPEATLPAARGTVCEVTQRDIFLPLASCLCALAPYFPFPYAGWSYRMPVPVLLRFAEEEQALQSPVHRGDIWWIPPSNPQTTQEKS